MKKVCMLLVMLFTFTGYVMAQIIENFESIDMTLFDAGNKGSLSVVPNPYPTGINTSTYVGKMVRGKDGQPWAGWYSIIPNPIDVSANKYMHIKVWKPRISPVAFKYEREGSNSGDVFSMEPQTMSEKWEELVFDMSMVSGKYIKIVLMPDFETPLTLTEDIHIYFDDIYVNNDPTVGSKAGLVIKDFEVIEFNPLLKGEDDGSKFTHMENPKPSLLNPSSRVVEFIRDKDGQPWSGFWSKLASPIDVTQNKYIHVKVWKPRVSVLKFRLEGGDAGNIEIPSMNPQTKTEEWEDIVFDFSEKTGTYPIIAFLPDFEDPVTLTEDITIYLDDIILNNDPNPLTPPVQVISVDMNHSGMPAGSKVWISGTFGGEHYIWAEPSTVPENEMTDEDGDGIYSITLNLQNGGYSFKFFWGIGWNNGDPSPGGNRYYTVNSNDVLKYVWGVQGFTPVESVSEQAFRIFPNPASNMLTIQSANMKRIVISDLLGRAVKNVKLQALNSTQVALNDLQPGIYIISVETSKGTFTSKFMKK